MTDDQLITFITVNKHLNYSKAAEELIVSQPTVTSRIKSLESELGCTLFDRKGYSLTLTKEGDVLLEYAINAVNYMNQAKTAVKYLRQPTIKVGFAPAFSKPIIISTLNEFKKKNDIRIFVYEANSSNELLKKIQKNELDVGFSRVKGDSYTNIEKEFLLEDKIVLLTSKQKFPKRTQISKNELKGETIIVHRRNTHIWNLISEELLAIDYSDNIEVTSLELLKEMIKEGWGSTIIHQSSLAPDEKKDLKIIQFEEPFFNIEQSIYIVNNKDKYIPENFNNIKESFVNAISSLKENL